MKKDRREFMFGKSNTKYGIFNTVQKKFQFGICEDTPMLAVARLHQKIGDDAKKWRFEPRPIPEAIYKSLEFYNGVQLPDLPPRYVNSMPPNHRRGRY